MLLALLERPDDALLPGWESRELRPGETLYVNWEGREATLTRPSLWDGDGALLLPDVPAGELDAFLSIIYPM